MSTPGQASGAQASGAPRHTAPGSAGPSTPAASGLPPSTAAAIAQNNASTPRSGHSTMHPSPANHRSPPNMMSPATARSLGATPMARAASSNTNGSAPGAIPMQRGHTTGMKGLGTPGRGGSFIGGKTVPGGSSAGAGLGIGAIGPTSGLAVSSPALHQSSPGVTMTPGMGNLNALAGFDSPATTGGAGFGGAVEMGMSLSNLGINMGNSMSRTGSTAARIDDEERRRRLEAVLDTLRKRPGRISREAVERLGRRCELDMQMDGEDELSLAGKNAVMLEVQFKPNKSPLVERVSVAFPTASDAMAAHVDKASKILQNDLTPPPGIAIINASLERFSDNLERLARLDKLSMPGANCFEAVFGVYTSLKRLYEHEKKAAEALMSSMSNSSEHDAETEVMCKKSGRPSMHSRRRVGLSLEYWKQKRLIRREQKPTLQMDEDAMDIDKDESKQTDVDEGEGIASITIECEASPPALYPTIRVTDAWLSERVEKPAEEAEDPQNETMSGPTETGIEWLDPPAPLIPTVEPDPMSAIAVANPSQPQARFVAKLEPPIVLPFHVAAQVYASVDINIMQESISPSTLDALILPHTQPAMTSGEPRQVALKRQILAVDKKGQSSDHEWNLSVFLSRAEPAVQIEQLPFSHPRQIIAMLPVFRQYAFTTALLKNSFSVASSEANNGGEGSSLPEEVSKQGSLLGATPTEADLMAFLAAPSSTPRTLDVGFSSVPSPRMTVNIPSSEGIRQVTFNVVQNGELEIEGQDIVAETEPADNDADAGTNASQKTERAKQGLARALLVSEDLGVWAEWVRGRFLGDELV